MNDILIVLDMNVILWKILVKYIFEEKISRTKCFACPALLCALPSALPYPVPCPNLCTVPCPVAVSDFEYAFLMKIFLA
jgi:hypothetical protein